MKHKYCAGGQYWVVILLLLSAMGSSWAASSLDLETQRQIYAQAQKAFDAQQWKQAVQLQAKIANYPLTPYLAYRQFLADLADKSPKEVNTFIQTYHEFPFSNRIKPPYLDELARQSRWQDYLTFAPNEPITQQYRCLYYWAHYQQGHKSIAFHGAQKLWLSGQSVAAQCDPLFEQWEQQGQLTQELVLARMALAFEQNNRALLAFLNKKLASYSGSAKELGESVWRLYQVPESVADFAQRFAQGEVLHNFAELALKKYARQEAEKALQLGLVVAKQQHWDNQRQAGFEQFIATRLMETESQSLARWRDQVIERSASEWLVEQRLRQALRQKDWQAMAHWVSVLPLNAQHSTRWQYWLARSEIELGLKQQGLQRLQALLGQRNFYSAASAHYLQQPIRYPIVSLPLNTELLTPYLASLDRIQELLDLEKITAAKSEWHWLIGRVNQAEKEALTLYSWQQNWYHFSIMGSISAQLWDHMELRFPLAYSWLFAQYAQKQQLDPIMLMSLARQESAMDSQAQSPVGARGLMQIMPSTAKEVAKKHKLTYRNADDLYQIEKNVEIGSQYLGNLLQRYENNRIFAFAAYNAGPSRVEAWRKTSQGQLDAYAFIESIPFKETRGYIQNILMFETYYRDQMGKQAPFLYDHEMWTQY